MTATNQNIENLLRHQDWVRALARSLVADPSRAEDVAQQTMLEAITSAPRDLQRPKGWLAQVARNAARAFARSDRRRQLREHKVAKSDVVLADPADAVHRAAAHRSLVDAVFELPEPYHTVVLLRYFEDLEPRQIAGQLDRSVSTVRTQLQRGLTMMRDKLDRQFGDRGAWHAAVLPVFAPKQVAAGVPILTAIGSLAMWKILVPVVAVIAALFIGLETMWAKPPAIPGQGGSGASVVAAASDTTDKKPVPVGRDELSVTPVAGPAANVAKDRFHARVVSPDGMPLAGLTLVYDDYWSPRLEGQTLRAGQSNPPTDLSDMLGTREQIEAFARRFGDQAHAAGALRLGQELDRSRAVTDAQGNFSFDDPEVESFLRVELDGHMIYGSGRLPLDDRLVYVVGPSVDVKGHIVDEHGKWLPRVHLGMSISLASVPGFGQELAKSNFKSWGVSSSSDGSFTLGPVPRHPALRVSASKAGYKSISNATTDIRGPVRWQLRSKSGQKPKVLTGIVRFADGRRAPNAKVVFGGPPAISDERGRFELAYGYNSDGTSLLAYVAGRQPAVRRRFAEQLDANPELAHNIVLELGAVTLSLSGRVLGVDGEPLQGVVVLLADGVLEGSTNQWIETVLGEQDHGGQRTDASGAFTLKGLSARTYNVRVIDEVKSFVLESGPVQAGTYDLVMRVPANAFRRLEGVVVDSHLNPIADVSVRLVTPLMASEGGTFWHALADAVKTDARGRFVFDSCPRKHAHLSIDGPTIKNLGMQVPDDGQLMRVVIPRWLKFRLRITSALSADHFAVLDSAGNRIKSLCHMVGVRRSIKTHPIVAENAPFYEAVDHGTELLLLKDNLEVGRVPLNLRINQLNVIDI